MSYTCYLGIGILFVLMTIGLYIYLDHNSLEQNNKRIYIIVGALQIFHIVMYLTGLLDKIVQINVYIAFLICAIISIVCLLASIWMLLSSSKFKHGIKYLLMFIAVSQVISTIIMFLLPEAGIPPLIHF